MRTPPELLEQPVERAARVVALILLENAQKARQRIDDPSDGDAAHGFRVAIRRLRSWLRALGPWLEDSIPKKAFRRLEKAARLTGDSRDAEVHLTWLEAQRAALSVRQRRGLNWLVEHIEAEKKESDHVVTTKGARAFDRARGRRRGAERFRGGRRRRRCAPRAADGSAASDQTRSPRAREPIARAWSGSFRRGEGEMARRRRDIRRARRRCGARTHRAHVTGKGDRAQISAAR